MTIKEKAKAYDEALERAKEKYAMFEGMKQGDVLEDVFPELRDSEDERIRMKLLNLLKELLELGGVAQDTWSMNDCEQFIAWLEKQGEQKASYTTIVETGDGGINALVTKELPTNGCDDEQKPADKVEPKFHEGDWAVSNLDKKARRISEVHFDEYNSYYVVDGESVNLEEYDRLHHLWTIQDAKDGDVLVHNGCTFIFMGIKNGVVQALEENLFDGANPVSFGEPDKDNDYYPATKEQRDVLFQKMHEAGYEWDTEKKLRKCEQKHSIDINKMVDDYANNKERGNEEFGKPVPCMIRAYRQGLNDAIGKVVLNPAWSEEDEDILNEVINHFDGIPLKHPTHEVIGWLVSIKQRIKY